MNDMFQVVNLDSLLSKLGWTHFSPALDGQQSFDWHSLSTNLLNNELRAFVIPLSKVPFEREDTVQICAVGDRLESGFYMRNTSKIKNLAFLGESHTLHYSHPLVEAYVRNINENVTLAKCDEVELQNKEIAIHVDTSWCSDKLVKLSIEEFIPPVSQGIFVLCCRKDDIDFRQKASQVHSKVTAEVSNVERTVAISFDKRKDVELMSIHSTKDDQGNIHSSVALRMNKNNLKYIQLSQSTTHEYVKNLLARSK